ncbi:MAG: hypothetical protein IPP72_19430 [Chitinophagaceae bacterium]|nr:hypothetical protein [Chitinophagaceae bacterium]
MGGGRAFLDILCSGSGSKTGVSGNLTNSFNQFPLYSWSTMVITHETGHNLGSSHTQNCGWPGGAIDNCYPTEGGCAQGPAPVGGGTMMSYCHLTGYGINFAKGFGPLPGYLIRSRVRNSTCINPVVNFETTLQTVMEENATVENGCFDYALVTAKIKINYTPSQPATVTLLPTIPDGLEIGPDKDIEISPVNFIIDSTNLSQTISFKVYNDALTEGTESLLINFNLDANGGNAVKRNTNNSHTINITETDHGPYETPGQPLFQESFDSISNGLGNWEQTVVYGTTSPNRWIVGYSADPFFAGKSAYISNDGGTYAYAGYTASDSSIVRLVSPVINASGFTSLHLSYLYKCVGEYTFVQGGGTGQGENIVGKDYGKLLYSIDNGSNWILLKDNISGRYSSQLEDIALPAAANNSSSLRIAFEWRNNDSVVNNPPY